MLETCNVVIIGDALTTHRVAPSHMGFTATKGCLVWGRRGHGICRGGGGRGGVGDGEWLEGGMALGD
jgi:hypothetical protein